MDCAWRAVHHEDADERLELPWPGFRFFFRRLGVRGRGGGVVSGARGMGGILITDDEAPFGDEGNATADFMVPSSDGSQL